MTEFELKFQVPADRRASVEAAVLQGHTQRQRLRARYFDTPAEALARAGAVLRLRQEGRLWMQTAKATGDSAFHRLEDNVALPRGAPREVDLARHAGSPAGAALARALAASGEDPGALAPTFETDIVRVSRTIESGRASVELAFDSGWIRAGDRALPVLELEFELKQGSAAGLAELARQWCETHGLWLDPLSKAEAGGRLALGLGAGAPRQAMPALRHPASGAAWMGSALGAGLEQALWNAREIASDQGEAEHVHQLRVALRRLRVLLRALAAEPALAGSAEAEATLAVLFSSLGRHRDLTSLLPDQQAELAAAGAPPVTLPQDLPDIGAAVRAAPVQAALVRLLQIQQALVAAETAVPSLQGVRERVAAQLERLHRQAFKAGLRFHALAEPQRHQARKRFKRLRYLAELARPLFAPRKVDRYVGELKTLQDVLGSYQDAAAGRLLWTAEAAAQPAAWFAAGWFAERERQLAFTCEKACKRAAQSVKPFWQG